MPALKWTVAISLILHGIAYGFSGEKPEVVPMPDFNRSIPVQLFAGTAFEMSFTGRGVAECFRHGELSEIYYISSIMQISMNEGSIAVYDDNGEVATGLSELKCKPRGSSSFVEFDGKNYRGFFLVVFDSLINDLKLYNIVDLEDYLKGVLPAEIGERTRDEYEAARAQAVASRTYAVWKMISEGESGKLYPTIADQVYSGKDAEIDLLDKAIEETEGEILMYKGGPIAAYYHAVCGGKTIPIEKAWPDKDRLPYLAGTDDDHYCAWAKTYSWVEIFGPQTLSENLREYFTDRDPGFSGDFDDIIDIEFHSDTTTGRMIEMKIITETDVYTVECDQIRWALGRPSRPGTILPSTLFTVEKMTSNNRLQGFVIKGLGNGHGVGVCQCGLIGRAREGQDYDEMLKQYYTGVELVKIY